MIEQVFGAALKQMRYISFQNGAPELMKVNTKELKVIIH